MSAIESKRGGVPKLGAWRSEDGSGGYDVRVWAPEKKALTLHLFGADGTTPTGTISMVRDENGFFTANVPKGRVERLLYKVALDGEGPFPDPWSRAQPFGVHGPSSVSETFAWTDAGWKGITMEDLVLYELHVGTATKEGTFEALIPKLEDLRRLGVTALELLPVGAFPGKHNWGYDGVSWFAPHEPYGGTKGLKKLVDAAHAHGLGVVMDVVYNHLGPDGNYLSAFSSSYFRSDQHTPWGDAIAYSDTRGVVRELALSNAEMWIAEYHLDGLRLDATHAIIDDTRPHLLAAIGERARAAAGERNIVLMAEDERNDTVLTRPTSQGGYGLDAVWADDFHHQMRRAFAGDTESYFQDYTGSSRDLVSTLEEGWFYHGQHSKNLGHARGTPGRERPVTAFIHCIQNHDQVGNRPLGNRLATDVSPEAYRAMSALLLLSPYTPMLFAGQEWNSKTPFIFFTDHNEDLGKLVTEGRRKEFSKFAGFSGETVPDPQAASSFTDSTLDWNERTKPGHAEVLKLYQTLLDLRRSHPALVTRDRGTFSVQALGEDAVTLVRRGGGKTLRLVVQVRGFLQLPVESGSRIVLTTNDIEFGGKGRSDVVASKLILDGPVAVLFEEG